MVATVHLADEANALRALTNVKTIQITTGASPLVITPDEHAPPLTVYEVTSGGTGGREDIHLLRYPASIGTYSTPQHINKRVVFIMAVRTNPSDVIHTLLYDPNLNLLSQRVIDVGGNLTGLIDQNDGGTLEQVGYTLAYAWFNDDWYFDIQSVDFDSSTDVQYRYQFYSGYNIDGGDGNDAFLQSGYAKSGSGQDGGYASLIAGTGDGVGTGGGVVVQAGGGGVTGEGGPLNLTAGNGGATSGNGGSAAFNAGNATTDGFGGNFNIAAGTGAANKSGGSLGIYAGDSGSTGDGNGGAISLFGGAANDTGAGGGVQIIAGDGGATSGFGGTVEIRAGNAPAGNGGDAGLFSGNATGANGLGGLSEVRGGTGYGTGNGGNAILRGGGGAFDAGNTGSGGTALVTGGDPSVDGGNGGDVNITGGSAQGGNGDGGDILVIPGAKHGSGVAGHFIMALENFADDAAAATGGVPVNGWYRTASVIKVRVA